MSQYMHHKPTCPYCDKTFASSNSRYKHINRQHEKEIEESRH